MALFEKEMVACGVYLVVIAYAIPTPIESRLALWRAHELDRQIFRGEQAFVSGHKPGEREDGAAGDVAGDFCKQGLPHGSDVGQIFYSRLKNIAGKCISQSKTAKTKKLQFATAAVD